MTRNGKIARLPHRIRDQLNRRLQDGEQGRTIVPWLNALPEVQAVMQAEFNGRPIRAQNISEWRKAGFREWQLQQDALEQVPAVVYEAMELDVKVGMHLTERLAVWLTAHLMAVVRRLAAGDLTDAVRWKLLHEACADLVALHRSEQNSQRIDNEHSRLCYLKQDLELRYKSRFQMGLDTIDNLVKKCPPQTKAAWKALLGQIHGSLQSGKGVP